MDRVRFGRALGYGARHAAKSLLDAAEAAKAPAAAPLANSGAVNRQRGSAPVHVEVPSTVPTTGGAPTQGRSSPVAAADPGPVPTVYPQVHPQVQQILRGASQVRAAQREAGKHARRSFFGPVAKFSSVVSLQVTGTFFALLALIMAQAAWRSRAVLPLGWSNPDARRLYLVTAVGLLFAYFALSNFLRARRRDRRT